MTRPGEDVSRLLHAATSDVTAPPWLLEQVRHGATRRLRRRRRGAMLASAALAGLVGVGAMVLAPGGTRAAPPSAPAATAAPTPSPTPTRLAAPAVLLQTVAPTRVFTASGDSFFGDGTTLQRHPPALAVTKTVTGEYGHQDATALLVVFPLASVAAACVQQVSLELDVTATTGGPAEVGVYPGAATSLVGDRLPPTGEDSVATLIDNRPRGVVTLTRPGLTQVDITALYRVWAAGGPFPSTRTLPAGTPLLLVLRPTAGDAGIWTVALGGPPSLTYRNTTGCR